MKYIKTITILVIAIMLGAAIASSAGIFSGQGTGPYSYTTIRGEEIMVYGRGLYRHMSADVAIQGIAQDYVTLFLAVPLLGVGLYFARKNSLRGRLFLAGTLGYFLVTYLFYLVMAMYNELFLLYAALMGLSFFALACTMLGFDLDGLSESLRGRAPVKFAGGFLIFNAFSIGFMWLSVVLPPLFDSTVYPVDLAHYTTLIVQGLDLGLLLPLSFISGRLLRRESPLGYLMGPIYLVFLSFLMTALVAKITAMGLNGVNIIPAIFIIPATTLVTMICAYLMLKPAGTGQDR